MEVRVKAFGYTRDQLESLCSSHIGSKNIGYSVSEQFLDAHLVIINQGEDERVFNSVSSDILVDIKDNLYGEGNATLGQMVIEYLKFHKYKLSIAESLTGGLISSAIVEVSGASEVLHESLVTYSNESKIKRLNVSRFTLESYGAVSYECAHEMAEGLLKNRDIDIAVSVTGIAGPSGGTDIKPVGLTYICVSDRNGFKVYNHCFTGDRTSIRMQAANCALFYIIYRLKNR